MKTQTVKQHIVPNTLIKKWCFKKEGRPDNFFYLMNKSGNISLEKRRKNAIFFAKDFFFEDERIGIVDNRIENKLSSLESDYAKFADRIIARQYNFIKGKIEITPYDKCLLLTFGSLQFFRTKLIEFEFEKRNKLLRKIELFLDFYKNFTKMSIKNIEEKCLEVRSNFESGFNKFKNSSPKKFKNFCLNFYSDPSNKIFFELQDFENILLIKRYKQLIWPLPVLGWFGIKIGDEQSVYESKIWPLAPNVIIATYPYSDFKYLNQNFINKNFISRFDDEEYLSKDFLLKISIWYLNKMELPIVLPKIFFDFYGNKILYKKIWNVKITQIINEHKEINLMKKREIWQRKAYRRKIYAEKRK